MPSGVGWFNEHLAVRALADARAPSGGAQSARCIVLAVQQRPQAEEAPPPRGAHPRKQLRIGALQQIERLLRLLIQRSP
jgi:hypothetical protein